MNAIHLSALPAMSVAGLFLALSPGGLSAAPDYADQWPQWRGPEANGVAPRGNPPTRWSETENVKWKAKLPGHGTGTPIVWGDRIYVEAAIPMGKPGAAEPAAAPAKPADGAADAAPAAGAGAAPADGGRRRRGGGGFGGGEKPTEVHQFVLLALDRNSGRTVWQTLLREEVPHEGHHRDHGFASHSPLTDGTNVYAWFGSRGLHCVDLNGKILWQKDLGKIRSANGFGEGSAPALHGDTLVVNWDHEGEDFIAAFDKTSGKELWRQPRNEKTTWATPLIVEHNGRAQVIVSASQRIRSYELLTGRQIWECGGMTANVIPSPVAAGDMAYLISGFRGNSLLAIKLGRTGDLTDTDAIAWKHGKSTPYVPSPLLYDHRLYFFAGNNAVLSCFDVRSGKPLIDAERLEGPSGFYASPVGAAGRVYLAGRNGTSIVLKHGDALEVLATNKLDDKFDASPAVVGRQLFLRGQQNLYCLAEP